MFYTTFDTEKNSNSVGINIEHDDIDLIKIYQKKVPNLFETDHIKQIFPRRNSYHPDFFGKLRILTDVSKYNIG